mmetsp:Transcript_91464/g.293812  ORF Transcript_91464/g.293812 Transcript_91464/m.293812 type:complete len:261 (+) Transcript_91464:249-1031(+)
MLAEPFDRCSQCRPAKLQGMHLVPAPAGEGRSLRGSTQSQLELPLHFLEFAQRVGQEHHELPVGRIVVELRQNCLAIKLTEVLVATLRLYFLVCPSGPAVPFSDRTSSTRSLCLFSPTWELLPLALLGRPVFVHTFKPRVAWIDADALAQFAPTLRRTPGAGTHVQDTPRLHFLISPWMAWIDATALAQITSTTLLKPGAGTHVQDAPRLLVLVVVRGKRRHFSPPVHLAVVVAFVALLVVAIASATGLPDVEVRTQTLD